MVLKMHQNNLRVGNSVGCLEKKAFHSKSEQISQFGKQQFAHTHTNTHSHTHTHNHTLAHTCLSITNEYLESQ